MLRKNLGETLSVVLGLAVVAMFLSCMSTEERAKIKQWELEGRNIRTGLFDEPYSGRSFQEKEELEKFMTTDDYQRAFDNHQRFLVVYNENQQKVDEQNRIIDAENAAIDRRNAEIDRTWQANEANVRNAVERHYQDLLRRFRWPSPGSFNEQGRGSGYTNNGRGYIYIFTLTEQGKIVHSETVDFSPPSLPPKETKKSRVSNNMRYNPNVTY